jgi:hypothetical protein
MRNFLLCFCAVATLACRSGTEPSGVNCTAPGDTIGYAPLIQKADSLILHCFWLLEDKNRCFTSKPTTYTASDCTVGQKWKGY